MIKNKKSLYFIVPVFVIVWAIVGFRVYRLFFSTDKNINPAIYSRVESKDNKGAKRYEPTLNYPDPFLGATKKKPVRVESIIKDAQPTQTAEVPVAPSVTFIGLISTTHNSKQAIIKYLSKTMIVETGDSIHHYRVISVSSDSLVLSKGINRWSIKLSNENSTD